MSHCLFIIVSFYSFTYTWAVRKLLDLDKKIRPYISCLYNVVLQRVFTYSIGLVIITVYDLLCAHYDCVLAVFREYTIRDLVGLSLKSSKWLLNGQNSYFHIDNLLAFSQIHSITLLFLLGHQHHPSGCFS